MKTTLTVTSVEKKLDKKGQAYQKVLTEQGCHWNYETSLFGAVEGLIGKPTVFGVDDSSSFKMIKEIHLQEQPTITEERVQYKPSLNLVQASKEQGIKVSYKKDLVVSGKSVEEASEIIEQLYVLTPKEA